MSLFFSQLVSPAEVDSGITWALVWGNTKKEVDAAKSPLSLSKTWTIHHLTLFTSFSFLDQHKLREKEKRNKTTQHDKVLPNFTTAHTLARESDSHDSF